jgi:hypothetical protein
MVPRGADLNFRQFWMEKLMGVSFSSFLIPQVPPMIKIKTQWAKNKVYEPQVASRYLTLKYMIYIYAF